MTTISELYKIINSLELKGEEMDKLQIYLIKNYEEEERLFLTLKRYKTKESQQRFLKSFLKSIHSMLDKIFVIIIVCDTMTKSFFFDNLTQFK